MDSRITPLPYLNKSKYHSLPFLCHQSYLWLCLLTTFTIFFSVLQLRQQILSLITCLQFHAMLDPILHANFVYLRVDLDDMYKDTVLCKCSRVQCQASNKQWISFNCHPFKWPESRKLHGLLLGLGCPTFFIAFISFEISHCPQCLHSWLFAFHSLQYLNASPFLRFNILGLNTY